MFGWCVGWLCGCVWLVCMCVCVCGLSFRLTVLVAGVGVVVCVGCVWVFAGCCAVGVWVGVLLVFITAVT